MKFKKHIHIGDTRQRPVFALFPTDVGGVKLWLEWYVVEEVFHEESDFMGTTYFWKEVNRFVPK